MPRKLRRIIFFSIIGIFLVLSPGIVLYTMGYRYDLKNHSLRQVGMIYIENNYPADADIIIDYKYIANKSNQRINNLLPGEYNVIISKDKYLAWEKNVSVVSKYVTNIANVILFPANPDDKIIISGEKIKDFTPSPNYENIAYLKDESINIYDLKKGANLKTLEKTYINQIFSANDITIDDFHQIKWLDENTILINASGEEEEKYCLVINTKNETIKYLKGADFGSIGIINDLLFYLHNQAVYSYNLTNDKQIKISGDKVILGVKVYENKIYTTSLNSENNELGYFKYDQISKDYTYIGLTDIKGLASYQLLPTKKTIAIIDGGNNLYFYSIEKNNVLEIESGVKEAQWSTNEEFLAIAKNYEVGFIETKNNNYQKNILARYSNTITSIHWHPKNNYLFFTTGGNIKISELDTRNKINIYNLQKSGDLHDLPIYIDDLGEYLYYYDSLSEALRKIYLK